MPEYPPWTLTQSLPDAFDGEGVQCPVSAEKRDIFDHGLGHDETIKGVLMFHREATSQKRVVNRHRQEEVAIRSKFSREIGHELRNFWDLS